MADKVNRRSVLLAGATGLVGGAAVSAGVVSNLPAKHEEQMLRRSYSPHEVHQAGIVTPTPASTQLLSFTLKPETDVDALGRLMRVWSTDIKAMMSGAQIPGDTAPEMAQANTSCSITVGFGPKIFEFPETKSKRPAGFMEIPPMQHDRLQERWNGGDLCVLVAADDATTVSYCVRRLVRDAEVFADLKWIQHGSWRGTDEKGSPLTGRNLFGQVDGTGNPDKSLHDEMLWSQEKDLDWFVGGTQLVVRRIEMDLDDWDLLTRDDQELVIGRDLATGAPLTGEEEQDDLDLAAEEEGRPVIPLDAHARRCHPSENNGRRMVRRAMNYTHDDLVDGKFVTTSGLLFLAFQANIAEQFVPVQQRIDEMDALNEWTTAIGSAVFAMPGGFAEDSWIGEKLFS